MHSNFYVSSKSLEQMVKFSFVTIFLMGLTRTALSQGSTTPSDVYVDNVCICVTAGFCGLAGGDGGEICAVLNNFFEYF